MLLACDDQEMGAAVELPRTLVAAEGERFFLTIGNDLDPLRGDAEEDQVVAHRTGPALAARELLLAGVAHVAVALDENRDGGVLQKPRRI